MNCIQYLITSVHDTECLILLGDSLLCSKKKRLSFPFLQIYYQCILNDMCLSYLGRVIWQRLSGPSMLTYKMSRQISLTFKKPDVFCLPF